MAVVRAYPNADPGFTSIREVPKGTTQWSFPTVPDVFAHEGISPDVVEFTTEVVQLERFRDPSGVMYLGYSSEHRLLVFWVEEAE